MWGPGYTSGKREKSQKTYDHLAFGVDEVEDYVEETGWEPEESMEEDLEALAVEDDDASTVLQFENAVMDAIQEDKDLATFYVSYQDARKHFLDKSRSRGFWPTRTFEGGKKGKGKGVKGKSKSLAHRIANSTCRLCGQAGHWKAECPSQKSLKKLDPSMRIAAATFFISSSPPARSAPDSTRTRFLSSMVSLLPRRMM